MSEEQKEITNPVKAIRAKCLDCSGGSYNEVEKCPVKDCALYQFRFGKNPYRTKRSLTDEEKAVAAARLAKYRGKKNTVAE